MKRLFLLNIIFALVLLVGCSELIVEEPPTATLLPSSTPTCDIVSASYFESVDALIERWDDANAIATSTARIALSGPLSDLQEIRREANDLEPPSCAQEVHDAMIVFMDAYIQAYLDFMAEKTQTTINVAFFDAGKALEKFLELMIAIR